MKQIIIYSLVVLSLLGVVYYLYQQNQRLKVENQIKEQNRQALVDSLNTVAGKVTVLTSFVADLNSTNQSLKHAKIAAEQKIKVLTDSLSIVGHGTSVVSDDSVYVSFSGKKKIATYKGSTTYYFKNKESNYALEIGFDPISVKSLLFKDSKDDLWKIRTESETEGVQVKGISTIDDETFKLLQKYPEPNNKFLALNLFADYFNLWSGIGVKLNQNLTVNVNYRVTHQQDSWTQNLLLGIQYFIF